MKFDRFFDEDQDGKLEIIDLIHLVMAFIKMVCSESAKMLDIVEKVANDRSVVTALVKVVDKLFEDSGLSLPVKIDDLVARMSEEGSTMAIHAAVYEIMQGPIPTMVL